MTGLRESHVDKAPGRAGWDLAMPTLADSFIPHVEADSGPPGTGFHRPVIVTAARTRQAGASLMASRAQRVRNLAANVKAACSW